MPEENIIQSRPYLLKNQIQNYAWGTRNREAFIPQFLHIPIENDKPYAELWIGAHPKSPSMIEIDGHNYPLNKIINQNPNKFLGKKMSDKFSNRLPFLLKILSAGEALSIQAHPNKNQAEWLHRKDPEHYPDDNHKPEIAIALDSLTALVGFRTIPDMISILEQYQEIKNYIGAEYVEKLSTVKNDAEKKIAVKNLYSTIMKKSVTNHKELSETLEKIESRIKETEKPKREEEILFLQLKKKYGIDIGLLSIFMLNLVHLKVGEAIFLKAGVPHAYLKGNIIECMANSDNVVRAGLTPKFKDVETLVDILTYETDPIKIMDRSGQTQFTRYDIPIPDFCISSQKLHANQHLDFQKNDGLKIFLVIDGRLRIKWDGDKLELFSGQSFLIPADLKNFSISTEESSEMVIVEIP